MGRAVELFGLGTEVRGTRSLDRLELPPAICPLELVVNNSRFLILPDWHLFNLGSRVLSLCQRRLPRDWEEAFGHGVVLLETFVDPQRHRGTVYRAANWIYVGNTRGFRRTRVGYTATPASPKMVFLKLLRADARRLLCRTILSPPYHLGGSKMKLTAEQMRSLPCFFSQIPDPRPGPKGGDIVCPRCWG